MLDDVTLTHEKLNQYLAKLINEAEQRQTEEEAIMAKFKISTDDLNRSKVVDPGWYAVEVTDYNESVAKTDGSTNATIEMRILDGPFKGAMLFRLFNEKAPGFIIPFLRALGVDVPEDGGEFDLSATVGRKLRVYVKNEEWQGQLKNRVEDFKSL